MRRWEGMASVLFAELRPARRANHHKLWACLRSGFASWSTAVAALLLTGCDPSGLARAVEAARTAVSAAVNGSETRPSDSLHSIRTTGPVYAASEDVVLARAWFERNFIGGYRRVGRRNPKWDLAAEAFIRESAPIFMGLAAPASQDLSARAHDLVQAGCDDPVVLYFAARATFFKDPNSREASELVERAVAGMHDVAYPRAVARFAASGLWADYNRRGEGTGKRASLAPVELSWFLESLKDGSYAPHDGVVLTLHLTTGPGESFVERNRAAVVAALGGSLGAPSLLGLAPARRRLGRPWRGLRRQGQAGGLEGIRGEPPCRAAIADGGLADTARPTRGPRRDDHASHGARQSR